MTSGSNFRPCTGSSRTGLSNGVWNLEIGLVVWEISGGPFGPPPPAGRVTNQTPAGRGLTEMCLNHNGYVTEAYAYASQSIIYLWFVHKAMWCEIEASSGWYLSSRYSAVFCKCNGGWEIRRFSSLRDFPSWHESDEVTNQFWGLTTAKTRDADDYINEAKCVADISQRRVVTRHIHFPG